ncbi:MAG: hypothetical protein ACRCVJ_12275 [Clostridium sp.]|uniref:hypothetical protein n=1 Tax=Clostridium sp. TaxID=1506 RepID=UPI003F36D31F
MRNYSTEQLINELQNRENIKTVNLEEDENGKLIVSGKKGLHERYVRVNKGGKIIVWSK